MSCTWQDLICVDLWMNIISEGENKQMNGIEWMNEWTNEWINEQMS